MNLLVRPFLMYLTLCFIILLNQLSELTVICGILMVVMELIICMYCEMNTRVNDIPLFSYTKVNVSIN